MLPLNEVRYTLDRDGVVSLGKVLTAEEVGDFRCRLDRLCLPEDRHARSEVRDLADLLDGPSSDSVLQRVNLYRSDSKFDALMRRPDFLDIAECVLGKEIMLFRDQCFYKPPRRGGEVYMHQDNRYWHLDPPLAVILFIALDDCTVETGCVHFIRGSHRWGNVQHTRARNGTSILLEAEVEKRFSVPYELPAGHATVHHCQTLHWSPPNRSTQLRRAHTIEYVAGGVTSRGEPLQNVPVLRTYCGAEL
jgi:2-oxoglutarate-dependent dioxygenase